MIFIDSNGVFPVENISSSNFSPFNQYWNKKRIPRRLISKPAYLQFTLINNTDTDERVYFYPGMLYDGLDLFKITTDGKPGKVSNTKSKTGFVLLSIPSSQTVTYLLKLTFSKTDYNRISAVLIKPEYLENYKMELTDTYRDNRISSYILCGVLLMMILFALVNYFLNYKKEFLYFSLFAVCMFFLIFYSSYLSKKPGVVTAFFRSYFDLTLLITGNIFYLAFVRKFLDTKINHGKLDKLLKTTSLILMVMLLSFTYIHFATDNVQLGKFIENSMKIVALIIGVIFIIKGLRKKVVLINYIAIGSAAQIFFSVISLILILTQTKITSIFKSALFYFEISIVMAIIFFLLGLTYKNRRDLIEKIQEKETMKLEIEKKGFETRVEILKAQQEERNRISEDMHDDLGAGMTTIRLFSEIAKTKMGDHVMPEIEKISASANELLNKMNAIIWSMSNSNDSLGNMVAYIRSYALEYLENTGIDCKFSIPETLPNIEVPGEIRRNIFLVVKEALNNIVKHSGASQVKIILEKHYEGFALIIHDNGHGIDLEKIRQFGNGLKNMKKRMDSVDIDFSIENKNGTVLRLYRKTRP